MFKLQRALATPTAPLRRSLSSIRMSLLEFMTFTVKADPSLEGSTPEDKASIEKLTPQTEGWAKDLPVSESGSFLNGGQA